jgi:ribosome-binding factor A
MESTRLKKVNRLLEKDLGEIFRITAKNNFAGGLLSVTRVRVSPDLSVAKVYISMFKIDDKKQALHFINENKSQIRRDLALKVGKQLRIVPDLSFYEDDSLDYEENIDRLLRGEGENPIK